MSAQNLILGLYEEDVVKREIIKEILDHQGVIFDICNKENLDNYPLIISTQKGLSNSEENKFITVDDEAIKVSLNALTGNINLNEEDRIMASQSYWELEILDNIIKKYEQHELPFFRKWYWPDFKNICYIVSHDIDIIDNFPGTKNKKEFIKYLLFRLFLKNYGDNIDKILYLEDEKNVTSTFFFLSNYKRKFQRYMEFRREHIQLMKRVLARNREISLHGSSEAATDESILRKEKEELERIVGEKITGYRQHLLTYRFKLPESLISLSNLDFSHDLSISDNDIFGFMNGICYPYHPFIDNKKIDLIEIAVPYEDWISLSKRVTYKNQIATIDKLIETTKKYNGCLTFCIHNTYVDKLRYTELYNVFAYILNNCDDSYWITTSKSCAEWWRKRENAKIKVSLEGGEVKFSSDTELPIEITNDGKKIFKMLSDEKLIL